MDVNGHERLFNITLRQKYKKMNIAFTAVLLSIVTVGPSTMRKTHTLKWMQNGQ